MTDQPTGRFPDFLIIGGMKCGTTTLYEYLVRHPGIFMPAEKEPSYFSDHAVFAKGESWYREMFADCSAEQICGEASTSYSRFEEYRYGIEPLEWIDYAGTEERIAAVAPDIKLIYVLRHPVQRAYSHYSFLMQAHDPIPIEQALERHKIIVEAGLYIDQIERYLTCFKRSQMHFVLLEDLHSNPEATLNGIMSFLDVEQRKLTDDPIVANAAGASRARRNIAAKLDLIKRVPVLRQAGRLVSFETRKKVLSAITDTLANGFVGRKLRERHSDMISPLTDEIADELFARYAEPTQRLESFLGRDLSAWYR